MSSISSFLLKTLKLKLSAFLFYCFCGKYESRKLCEVSNQYLFIPLVHKLYKRYDPTTSDELEFMENLFNCLCSSLMFNANKDLFLKGEGLQLMILMLR